MIHVNGEMMKLYDNGQLTIIDAAMQAGFSADPDKLALREIGRYRLATLAEHGTAHPGRRRFVAISGFDGDGERHDRIAACGVAGFGVLAEISGEIPAKSNIFISKSTSKASGFVRFSASFCKLSTIASRDEHKSEYQLAASGPLGHISSTSLRNLSARARDGRSSRNSGLREVGHDSLSVRSSPKPRA